MSADPTTISGGERMFAHRVRDYKGHSMLVWTIIMLATLGFAGCGDDDGDAASSNEAATSSSTTADGEDADPEDLKVIEDWSQTLSEGDVEGAAGYFATPSTAENGPVRIEIETLEDAVAFNRTLPCGAEVISAKTVGEFTSATFRLSERPGGGCGSGAGGTASTSFVIEDGKIVEWRRIGDFGPVSGGDGGGAPV